MMIYRPAGPPAVRRKRELRAEEEGEDPGAAGNGVSGPNGAGMNANAAKEDGHV